ncbi:MAG: phage holin family protein [Actinomycetota bacterium]|nr:phage holin family protein [Actinomycetota bacterium]
MAGNYGANTGTGYPGFSGSGGYRGYGGYTGAPISSSTNGEEPSIGGLFAELGKNLQVLLQKEVELAKLELQDEASKAAKAGTSFGAMAAVGYLALTLLSFAAAWGLAEVIPVGFAFLAVGVVYLIVAAALYASGRQALRRFRPVPQQTVQTLKQDVQVAKDSVTKGVQSPIHASSWGRS